MTPNEWYDEPMRFLQINLVEDDCLNIDIDGWKEYWKSAHVEGLVVSAAGAVAYYPSSVSHNPPSRFLEGRDLFGEIVDAAKSLGIRVLARFEPSFASPEVFAAEPSWFRRDSEGRPTTMPEMLGALNRVTRPGVQTEGEHLGMMISVREGEYMPCWHGPFYRQLIPEIMTELAARYPIDGFFANGWPQPMCLAKTPTVAMRCHCPSCLEQWTRWPEAAGAPYPEYDDPKDPVWRAYVSFIINGSDEVQRLWMQHAKALHPRLTFGGCFAASASSRLDWRQFPVDFYAQDGQGRGILGSDGLGLSTPALWLPGRSAKMVRSAAGDTPLFQIVGGWRMQHETTPKYRRLSQDPAELQTLLAQAVAKNTRPWVNVAGGVLYDRRWQQPLADFFRWHHDTEAYHRDRTSGSRVGIIWSPDSVDDIAPNGPDVAAALTGWYSALMRARIPFDIVYDDGTLEPERLERFEVLIVPSGTQLFGDTSRAIESRLLAGESTIVGAGVRLPDPAAGALPFAVDAVDGPRATAYLDVTDGDGHPLLDGLGDTDYLPAGRWFAGGTATAGAAGRITAPLPFLADKAWLPPGSFDSAPLLYASDTLVVIGTDLDALHATTQSRDAERVLVNAVRHIGGGAEADVLVDADGLLDVDLWHQPDSLTVYLVNLDTPDAFGGPVGIRRPIRDITVRVKLPEGQDPAGAKLLVAGDEVVLRDVSNRKGWVAADISRVDAFEVLAVDYRP